EILEQKPSILVISKLDDFDKRDQFNRFIEILQQTNINKPSIIDRQNVMKKSDEQMNVTNENQQHKINDDDDGTLIVDHHPPDSSAYRFDKIIGISSLTGYNIDRLKGLIRHLIDMNAENNKQKMEMNQ
ncbi:hypothetical protein BLA29_010193, partial [Euroglyphus maynei]